MENMKKSTNKSKNKWMKSELKLKLIFWMKTQHQYIINWWKRKSIPCHFIIWKQKHSKIKKWTFKITWTKQHINSISSFTLFIETFISTTIQTNRSKTQWTSFKITKHNTRNQRQMEQNDSTSQNNQTIQQFNNKLSYWLLWRLYQQQSQWINQIL